MAGHRHLCLPVFPERKRIRRSYNFSSSVGNEFYCLFSFFYLSMVIYINCWRCFNKVILWLATNKKKYIYVYIYLNKNGSEIIFELSKYICIRILIIYHCRYISNIMAQLYISQIIRLSSHRQKYTYQYQANGKISTSRADRYRLAGTN